MADTISKDTMRALLAELGKTRTPVGPVDTGKTVEYRPADVGDILMDDRVSYKSPKEFYFPQVEKIVSFENDEAKVPTELSGAVIFGARPCDLEALRVMREVFLSGRYADPFFARRMDANLLIGVGCTEKKPGCFCDALGLDKGFSDFCDIMLNDTGDGYEVEYLSDKGREALQCLDATKGVSCDNTRKAVQPDGEVLGLDDSLEDLSLFSVIDWKTATQTCQGCGMCTFICPTCHCFEFKDVAQRQDISRYRCWDSCMYPKFTLHASGHNPRAARFERYRQRVLHKYLYVKKNTGLTACTGCGRCIRSCPVGMNIKSVVEQIREVL